AYGTRMQVSPAHRTLAEVQVVQITSSGHATRPAISPDGKYVVFVQRIAANQSLWVRQIAAASGVEIAHAESDRPLFGATVTPDGAYVDYVEQRMKANGFQLWRVPFLGGEARRFIEDVWTLIG